MGEKLKKQLLIIFLFLFSLLLVQCSFAADNNELISDENKSTDYYFDINAVEDGNGLKDTPYKNFTDERVVDNSKIHLADGEYYFKNNRSFTNISFLGENCHNTVLNGNGTYLNINGLVNFNNITLTNFNIRNNGNLNASNTIFTGLIPSVESNNNYGGAIYAPSNKNIYLENCTFFDTAAEYGGAIYVYGGNLTVLNSQFYNITAYNFGGAIVCESKVKAVINNTRFFNVKSTNDAGGALYLLSSSLNSFNLSVINSSSTFGSAIAALSSDLTIQNSTFENNTAKYEGGAIYQVYGSILLISSKFINNAARNGGGLFIDDVNVLNITFNEFVKNSALKYGGALYYLLNENINVTYNLFEGNSADYFSDIYNSSMVNLDIGNGTYTLYIYNQTSNLTIPSKYDLRDYGFVSPVKDQSQGGNCWAFASMAALESCILKASGELLDLSEENMKNLMALYSDYGINYRAPNDGGNSDMPIGYLVSWLGPVNERDDKYDDKSQLSPVLDSILHVQNVLYLKRDNFTDNDAIKQAILQYGAVATTMYWSYPLKINNDKIVYHYYTGNEQTNHAVTIVGWDDTVNIPEAPGNGAWIVKNSWGPDWLSEYGCNGYFYVSYYDTVFARPGTYSSYTFILNDTIRFDKNYQYDFSGPTDYFWYTSSSLWYENAYNATDNEFLAAVSTYFNNNTEWELNIYVNSKLQLIQNGTAVPGYFTINLDYPVPLVKGDLFEILFKIKVDGDAAFPIAEKISLTKSTYLPKTSFLSVDNGKTWYDLYNLEYYYPNSYSYSHFYDSSVACIKGFTQLTTFKSKIDSINVTYDSLDFFNIMVQLSDENNNYVRNGNVLFTVNNENYTVSVYNGRALLKIPFKLGVNNISCEFSSPNYYSTKANTTFELLPIPVNMIINITQNFNNVVVTFTCSELINESLTVKVNNNTYSIETVNGSAFLKLDDLTYGNYTITAVIDKDIYDCSNSSSFFFDVKKTHLVVCDFTTVYGSGEFYQVSLIDEFGSPVSGREVVFKVGDAIYSNSTDENGLCRITFNVGVSVYNAVISFEGDEKYVRCQNTSEITVKSSIYLSQPKLYTFNSDYEVTLLNTNSAFLNNTPIIITLNNIKYTITTDDYGKAVFTIPLTEGNYDIYITNPATGEIISQNINIIKRITENNGISAYFGSNPYYKLRVCGDYGEFVSGLQVKITINNKIYYIKTDKNGYALLKINLKSGDYIITAEYKGYKVSNKIVIKPTLITKSKSVKKGKTLTFTAKLLNKNGKILKNKKITFKIKGKTYKAKTNKKGIATIKIKNLKVGKYNIITKYSNLQNINKITVKK